MDAEGVNKGDILMSSNGFKAQYKTSANGAWQTKTSGTEQTCLSEYNRLKNAHPFARVIDSAGRVVT